MSKELKISPLVKACVIASSVVCLTATSVVASAQNSEQAIQRSNPKQAKLEEVVVTARKREETMQDVPATIGVISNSDVSNAGVASFQQIEAVAPGVNFTKPPLGSQTGITIRGLGSAPGVPSFDSSVSLFVDGVYAPRSREFSASMFDVERIEVVRGTQAALLGKNTSLGAISLITRKPGEEFAADVRVSYELEEGSRLLTGGVDMPLTSDLRVRLSGQYNQDEGWVKNRALKTTEPKVDDTAIRAVIQWDASEAFDLTLLAQTEKADNTGSGPEFVVTNGLPEMLAELAGYPGAVDNKLDRNSASTLPGNGGGQTDELDLKRYTATANWHLTNFKLTSITAFSEYDAGNYSDVDFLPGDYNYQEVEETGDQFSQELRLTSTLDNDFNYIVGALYLDGSLENSTEWTADYPFGPPGAPVNISGTQLTYFHQTSEAVSAFGQLNYDLSNELSISAGLRWTQEDKEVDMSRTIVQPGLWSVVLFPPFAPFTLSRTEKNLDFSLGAQYRLSDSVMLYTSYGKGTKGGGYAQSVTQLNTAEYDKEVAKTAEVGLKYQNDQGNFQFNTAVFNTDVQDFQLVTFTGVAFVVGNTDLTSRGVEFDTRWLPTADLEIYANGTYADSEDSKTGDAIPLAPKFTGNAGFKYQTNLNEHLDLIFDGSVQHRTKRYYQQNPATSPPGEKFTQLHMSMGLASVDDVWEVRLIGRNLADKNSALFGFPTPIMPGNQNQMSSRGRTVAAQLTIRF